MSTKRILDLAITIPGVILLSPLFIIIALAIRISMGSPVLFRQRRPGYQARPFYVIKFRTMLERNNFQGKPLADGLRLTPLGHFLRRTSLDELPELWNIVRGEMSLVGPRPLLECYLERYSPEQARRHEVLPGITGWAQIHGRNLVEWKQRLALDVWYVDHHTLWLDLQILWRTFFKVFTCEGVQTDTYQGEGEFMGDEKTGIRNNT